MLMMRIADQVGSLMKLKQTFHLKFPGFFLCEKKTVLDNQFGFSM